MLPKHPHRRPLRGLFMPLWRTRATRARLRRLRLIHGYSRPLRKRSLKAITTILTDAPARE